MNLEPTTPVMTETITTPCDTRFFPFLCWQAIIGGTVAAIGIHLLLTALGVGAGLATFTPMTDTNPTTNFSVGAAIVWSLCALVALAFGGFKAASNLSCAAMWSFFALLIGLLVTALAGRCGACCALRCADSKCAPAAIK